MIFYILIVYVTLIGNTNQMVHEVVGQFSYETCRDLIPVKVSEAKQRYQLATIKAECLQMVPQ